MNIDSVISRINRRISEIASTFGIHTKEYMDFKLEIKKRIPAPLLRERHNEPVKISRSKRALEGLSYFESEISEITKWMKGKTAFQLSKRYNTSGNYSKKIFNSPDYQKRIRKMAVAKAVSSGFELEWYSAIDEIDDNQIQLLARAMFGNVSEKGRSPEETERRYIEAVNFVKNALESQGEAIKKGTYRPPTEAQESAQQKSVTLGDIFGGLYKK